MKNVPFRYSDRDLKPSCPQALGGRVVPMRRRDREITSRQEIDAIIRAAEVCRLAFADRDEPYVVPVSFGYDGEALFIHTAKTGRKLEFIEANNYPDGIRGTLRDALTYSWVQLLGDTNGWRPEHLNEKYRLDVKRAEKILNRCLSRWLKVVEGLWS